MGISSAIIEFIVLYCLPSLASRSLLFLALILARASFFPAFLSSSRVEFLHLSLGFCSVIWDLQRAGKSCYPFENHEGSCVRGRRGKHGTSSLEANFAHRLDSKPSISTPELSQPRSQEFFLRTSRRES